MMDRHKQKWNVKIGNLYHFNGQHISGEVLCLKIYSDWHSDDIGEFLWLEFNEIIYLEIFPPIDVRFTELKDEN